MGLFLQPILLSFMLLALVGCQTSGKMNPAALKVQFGPTAGTPARKMDPAALKVQFGPTAGTPAGLYRLCRGGHEVCHPRDARSVDVDADGSVAPKPRDLAQVHDVNDAVNSSIRPVADSIIPGVKRDIWRVEPARGDCEDFALTKKSRLMELGWPSSALLIAMVRLRKGADHAVLVVRTTEGDLVLDNLVPDVKSWSNMDYRPKSIQAPDDQWRWRMAT
jgi:predicted transglutaminase-like cysteine proteinase